VISHELKHKHGLKSYNQKELNMVKYYLDKETDEYLVREVGSHEQEWYYCRGCEMKYKKPFNHHPNCPRSSKTLLKA
jgi:hypothetical protein